MNLKSEICNLKFEIGLPQGRDAMKSCSFLLFALLIVSLAWAQGAPSGQQPSSGTQAGSTQAPGPGPRAGQRAERRQQMQAMCKEHFEAMKADVQKMHAAFDRMKANVGTITNADEKARWQANVEMWQTVVDHHDQMLKHMEEAQAQGMGCGMMMDGMGMGPGMMHHPGMGPMSKPPTPPETKPQ
jgi:hypothetical protein